MDLPHATAELQKGVARGDHAGAQLAVSVAGALVAEVAVGEARPGVPMSSETLMPWFSATKPVTAAAVLQQWERGALELDEPITDELTVRQLLTHTEGLERAAYRPHGFEPLGELVRRADPAHRAFEAYVSEELFEPLDMADSWVGLTEERQAAYGDRVAEVRDTSGPEPKPVSWYDLAAVSPSGSGIGPMRDLVRFYEMLLGRGERDGNRVLLPQTVEAMTARHRVNLVDETFGWIIDWGLGVMVNSWHYRQRATPYGYGERASRRAFGHGGREAAIAFADPEYGLAVALGTNGLPGEARNHRRTQPVLTALYDDLGLGRG